MRLAVFVLILLLHAVPLNAHSASAEKLFDVNLKEKIPPINQLRQEYNNKYSLYNRKYYYRWQMPSEFNNDFHNVITNFGSIEKRLENTTEEELLQKIKQLPPELYPYIGPALHTVPGFSGKILDLPGIKETKNKFPSRIAADLEDIPYLEFASPTLYLYLMPEIWGEKSSIERPIPKIKSRQNPHPIRPNPEFIARIKKNVPIENFTIGAQNKSAKPSVRHFIAYKNTPLSGADVKAFIATKDRINDFINHEDNQLKMILIDSLIRFQDEKNGVDSTVSYLKNVVNPCQSIVRKVKWLGKYSEFLKAVEEQGFGLDEWAYTCDKTLKAYRVAVTPSGDFGTIRLARSGKYAQILKDYTVSPQEWQRAAYYVAAYGQMHNTASADIDAVRPYLPQLRQTWRQIGEQYGGTPIVLP